LDSTKPIKALIFDFDGLIIDSESPGFQAWSEAFAAHGRELPFEKYSLAIGTHNGFDPVTYLEELTGLELDKQQVEAQCNERWRGLMEMQTVMPGIVECISRAGECGLRVAIASSSTRDWVTSHLSRLGLADRFNPICCRDDVAAVKPEPDLYLLALDKLGIDATEAIAFEDSPNGILAAKRAGLYCVAVPNVLTSRLPLDLADRRVASVADVDLGELIGS